MVKVNSNHLKKSWLLTFDPRIKFICMLLLSFTILLPTGLTGLAIICPLVLFVFISSRPKYKLLLKIIPIFLTFGLLLLVMNSALVPWEKEWKLAFNIGSLKVSFYILALTLTILSKMFLTLLVSLSWMASTSIKKSIEGISWFLTPLKKAGIPSDDLTLMIHIGIRFLPTLISESIVVRRSLASRGIDAKAGFISSIKALKYSLLPIFVAGFKRTNDISEAMLVRGYKIGKERTQYKKTPWNKSSFISLGILLAIFIFFILLVVDNGNLIPAFADMWY